MALCYVSNHNTTIISCFPQPQYHHHFLLSLGGRNVAEKEEQWDCYCSVPWREEENHLSTKHLSPAGPKVLYKGGNHRASLADEQ